MAGSGEVYGVSLRSDMVLHKIPVRVDTAAEATCYGIVRIGEDHGGTRLT